MHLRVCAGRIGVPRLVPRFRRALAPSPSPVGPDAAELDDHPAKRAVRVAALRSPVLRRAGRTAPARALGSAHSRSRTTLASRLVCLDLQTAVAPAIMCVVDRVDQPCARGRRPPTPRAAPPRKRVRAVYRLPAARLRSIALAGSPGRSDRPVCSVSCRFAGRTRGVDGSRSCVPDAWSLHKSARCNSVRPNVYSDMGNTSRLAAGGAHRDPCGRGSGGAGDRMQSAPPATIGRPTETAAPRADRHAGLTVHPRRLGTPRRACARRLAPQTLAGPGSHCPPQAVRRRASQGRGWGVQGPVRTSRKPTALAAPESAARPQAAMGLFADLRSDTSTTRLTDARSVLDMGLPAGTRTQRGRVHPLNVFAATPASRPRLAPSGCIQKSFSARAACIPTPTKESR